MKANSATTYRIIQTLPSPESRNYEGARLRHKLHALLHKTYKDLFNITKTLKPQTKLRDELITITKLHWKKKRTPIGATNSTWNGLTVTGPSLGKATACSAATCAAQTPTHESVLICSRSTNVRVQEAQEHYTLGHGWRCWGR